MNEDIGIDDAELAHLVRNFRNTLIDRTRAGQRRITVRVNFSEDLVHWEMIDTGEEIKA